MAATISIEDWPTQSARLPPVHAVGWPITQSTRARVAYNAQAVLADAETARRRCGPAMVSEYLDVEKPRLIAATALRRPNSMLHSEASVSPVTSPHSDLVTGVRPEREA